MTSPTLFRRHFHNITRTFEAKIFMAVLLKLLYTDLEAPNLMGIFKIAAELLRSKDFQVIGFLGISQEVIFNSITGYSYKMI